MFRARDTRLGREVALKVLPGALAQDPERLSRFEQEARAASALNHPNIVTIHEIGREGDTTFIAMELVDGKTLRELEAGGPLPVRKILGWPRRSRKDWRRRTLPASSIGTSSPRTSWSRRTAS